MIKPGTKVVAFASVKNGVVNLYGEGQYIGNGIPDVEPFSSRDIHDPCIELENGKHIWGFQCQWLTTEEFKKMGVTTIHEIDNFREIKPKYEF